MYSLFKKNPGSDSLNELKIHALSQEVNTLKRDNATLSKELDFLKNQFNSHITFNFLNFCYSKVHKSSKHAAEAIETFADMLRYSSQLKPDEEVALKREIDYIENFIRIQRCITEKVYCDFKYEGRIQQKVIVPFVLIKFVENAFKYGEINNELYPIQIHLMAETDSVIFEVKNKKNPVKPIDGLKANYQNIKQMLDVFYEERLQLKIKETELEYHSSLILKI
ncbi:MAG TPA: histidine kinase [Bacteroidia bacterium]|jgi:LytS/YehU family sensor histidine kinase|nr:histidine kinase [Bacteroidia bacterium]